MIEQGCFGLKSVLSTLDPLLQSMKEGESLYKTILDIAFDWQRSGYIRKKHLEKLIIPALEQGCFVVCDRYSLSTYAYQMAQGVSLELIRKLHAEVINPDLTFFVDVDYNVAKKRILARGEKLEKFEKDEEFTKNLINNYRRLVLGSGENISLLGEVVKVNGNNSIREVGDEIIKNLQDYL